MSALSLVTPTRTAATSSGSGSVKWALDTFLMDCRAKDLTEDTLDFYRRKVRRFVHFLAENDVTRISRLESVHVREYMLAMREAGFTTNNAHANGRAIKAFLYWCAENELIEPSVARRFKLPKKAETVRDAFTMDQLTALVAASRQTPQPDRDLAILLLMIDTGIRAGEIGRIRDEHFEFERVLINGKGKKQRYVPISAQTRKVLHRWQKVRGESEMLFISRRTEHVTRQTIYKLFQRLGERAGVHPCHPHMMRRSVAVEWIRAGGDTFTLQDLLGHSTQTMSRLYVNLASCDVAEKHRKLSLVQRMAGKRAG